MEVAILRPASSSPAALPANVAAEQSVSTPNHYLETVLVDSPNVGSTRMHPKYQWQLLVGEIVVVWLHGELYRKGRVDDAMPDGSGLWIAQEGAFQRKFIDANSGFEVWSSLSGARYPG
ncbi:hypothetical protein AB6813_22255 [bacterium RCC_150]